MHTTTTFCRICESLCGLQVDVDEDRVIAVRPDDEHVATKGFACVKGTQQHLIYGSPDRLTQPLLRPGGVASGEHQPASWDDALAFIGRRVQAIRAEHGADAIAMYVGTAAGFSVLHPVFAQGFMTGLGSRSMYSSSTQDCSNKFAVAAQMYGFPFTQPFPDLDHTRCLIVVGANPVVSKWSFLQVPNPKARFKALVRRGVKLWFVDPRRSESAQAAGQHVGIRPGTDVFFFLAFLHELVARGAVRRETSAVHLRGVDALFDLVAPWSPERCATVTGVGPDTLRAMVDDYVQVDGAALYSSTGVNMGGHGALAFWLQEVIQAVTGNLDRRGGTLVGKGVIDFPGFAAKRGLLMRPDRSRVAGLPSVNDAFPGGVLADEILTPGPGQVRALFVTGGNPLLTMPNAERLRDALAQLELLVCIDILPTETASLAHAVLPATTPLERPDLPFIFPLMLGLQGTPYLQATRAVAAPPGECRDEASIYLDLAQACGVGLYGSQVTQKTLLGMRRVRRWRRGDVRAGLPQETLLSALLTVSGAGTFERLLRAPHGKLRPAHAPGSFLGQRVYTPDGRVELAPAPLLEAAAELESVFAAELRDADRFKLITRRDVRTHNSWTHNHAGFIGPAFCTNTLTMHPDDAAEQGLEEGDIVDVRSGTAVVRLPLAIDADLGRRTVALPHGWGHQHAKGLRVASRTQGVNVNLLAADGHEHLEPLSGMARLTGIVVDVGRAAGPRAVESWSGIAPTEG